MKVFIGVLALAGLAAAGVVLDSEKLVEQPPSDVRTGAMSSAESGAQSGSLSGLPTDAQIGAQSSAESSAHSGEHSGIQTGEHSGIQTGEHSGVQTGEHSGVQTGEHSGVQTVLESAVKPERPITSLNHHIFTLFGVPHMHHHHHHHERRHDFGLMKKILEGPVMVAFYDASPAVGGRMQAFLLPYGLEDMTRYGHEEIFPLVRYLTNGRRKSFLHSSAINYLRLPEMFLPLRELHLPSHNLNTAFRISEEFTSLPYVFISDDETLLTNNLKEKLDNLKEMGVFGLQDKGFKILRDNYPRDNLDELLAVVAHADPVRSVEYLVAVPSHVSGHVSAYAEEPSIRHDNKWFGLF